MIGKAHTDNFSGLGSGNPMKAILFSLTGRDWSVSVILWLSLSQAHWQLFGWC
jgi:hypothetical protein